MSIYEKENNVGVPLQLYNLLRENDWLDSQLYSTSEWVNQFGTKMNGHD